MREYLVEYDPEAEIDLILLRNWLIEIGSFGHALEYLRKLKREVAELSYRAGILPESRFHMPKLYHPKAKTMPVCKRKLTVIFHIEGDYVIVDKILPSAMVTY